MVEVRPRGCYSWRGMSRLAVVRSVSLVALCAVFVGAAPGCSSKPTHGGCGDAATKDVAGLRHTHADGVEHEHPATPGDRHTHEPVRCGADPAVDAQALPKLQ
jgi:hypothetical protein